MQIINNNWEIVETDPLLLHLQLITVTTNQQLQGCAVRIKKDSLATKQFTYCTTYSAHVAIYMERTKRKLKEHIDEQEMKSNPRQINSTVHVNTQSRRCRGHEGYEEKTP